VRKEAFLLTCLFGTFVAKQKYIIRLWPSAPEQCHCTLRGHGFYYSERRMRSKLPVPGDDGSRLAPFDPRGLSDLFLSSFYDKIPHKSDGQEA